MSIQRWDDAASLPSDHLCQFSHSLLVFCANSPRFSLLSALYSDYCRQILNVVIHRLLKCGVGMAPQLQGAAGEELKTKKIPPRRAAFSLSGLRSLNHRHGKHTVISYLLLRGSVSMQNPISPRYPFEHNGALAGLIAWHLAIPTTLFALIFAFALSH